MHPFELVTANTISDAVKAQASSPTAQQGAMVRFIAGGTNLVDYMKLNVETPRRLVDINSLGLDKIERLPDGSVRIGALARNSDVAHDLVVRDQFPVLSQAILAGASTQLRNMATTAGNLLQKTRCVYFRDTAFGCNKRQPGSGCSAIGGHNRMLAILGTSEHCIASNPSDQNVALSALDATVHITGVKGDRHVSLAEFYLLPANTPHNETVLEPGDLITHVSVPGSSRRNHQPVPQAPGPCFLRVRTCLDGRSGQTECRTHRVRAHRAGWCGDGALAQPGSGRGP